MNLLELFFLDLGFSWQLSTLMPFILCVIASSFVLLGFRKYRFTNLWKNIAVSAVTLLIPASLYFWFYPIYRGDVWDLSRKLTLDQKDANTSNRSLKVYVLPNCPFCLETIETIHLIHKRNPKLKIEYIIISGGGGGKIEKKLPSFVHISYQQHSKRTEEITRGSFPSFAVASQDALLVWDNNSFGARSLDLIESLLAI